MRVWGARGPNGWHADRNWGPTQTALGPHRECWGPTRGRPGPGQGLCSKGIETEAFQKITTQPSHPCPNNCRQFNVLEAAYFYRELYLTDLLLFSAGGILVNLDCMSLGLATAVAMAVLLRWRKGTDDPESVLQWFLQSWASVCFSKRLFLKARVRH